MEYISILDVKMKNINISIIIPATRNKDIFILVGRLYTQIDSEDEIIVIADTEKIDINMLKQYFPKIILLSEANISPARGRNLGINIAKSDFLLFLDDDILIDRSLIFDYKKTLSINKKCFGIVGSIKPYCKNRMLKRYYNAQIFSWRHDIKRKIFITCNLLLKNKGIKFDERFSFAYEDVALSKTLEDKPIIFSERCLVYHKMPNRISLFMKKFFLYGMGKKKFEKMGYSSNRSDQNNIIILKTLNRYCKKFGIYSSLSLCLLELLKYLAYYSGYLYEDIKQTF